MPRSKQQQGGLSRLSNLWREFRLWWYRRIVGDPYIRVADQHTRWDKIHQQLRDIDWEAIKRASAASQTQRSKPSDETRRRRARQEEDLRRRRRRKATRKARSHSGDF